MSELNHEKIVNDTKTDFTEESTNYVPKIDINDQNLLDTITRQYETKIVGEEKNIKTVLCSILSRDLPKKFRFSLIFLNQSGTGKSYLLNNVLAPFANTGDVIDFTDFSEAYFKRKFSNVNGKIIKIEQLERRDGNGISIQKLKHLLTEGVLKIGNADKNEQGQYVSKEFEIRGVPVILTTATNTNIDPETESRFLIIELDESKEQTEDIVKHILSEYSTFGNTEKWPEICEQLSMIFMELKRSAHFVIDIKIPFSDKLVSKIPKNLTIRRDLSKILGITSCLAFIHYKNRDRFLIQKPEHMPTSVFADTEEIHKGVVIAQVKDLLDAMEIAGNTFKQTINKTTMKTMEFYARIKKIANEKPIDNQGITMKDIMQDTGRKESTIRDHLKVLTENGFVDKDDGFKEHKYYPLEKKFSDFKIENLEYPDEEYKEWIKKNLEGNSYTFVSSRADFKLE